MKLLGGQAIKVPHSKVMDAYKAGYLIDPSERDTYARNKEFELKKLGKKLDPNTDLPEAYAKFRASPKFGTLEWVKEKSEEIQTAEYDLFPTVGGVLGGIVGAGLGAPTGPGDVLVAGAGAAAGGGLGEDIRQAAEEYRHPYERRMTPGEAAKKIATQAAVQGVNEVLGRTASKPLAKAGEFFKNTALASKLAGFPMLPSEAAGKAPSYLERLLKGHIFTAGKMEDFRALQNRKTIESVNKIADSISKWKGTSEELGKLVQDGIEIHKKDFHTLQNQLYGDIDAAVGEHTVQVPVQTQVKTGLLDASGKPIMMTVTTKQAQTIDNLMPERKAIVDFAKQELKKIQAGKSAAGKAPESKYETILKGIVGNKSARSTYQGMSQARSEWLALARDFNSGLSGPEQGFVKKMAGLADESMIDAAKKSGIPGMEDMIRNANEITANEHKMFEQALIDKIVKKKQPEAIATLIRGKLVGNQELRDLFTVIPKDMHKPIQRQVLLDTMRQSTNLQSKVFNERKFAEAIGNIGDERGNIIFGKNWNNIKQLTAILERINGPSGLSGGGSGAAFQNISAIKNALSVLGGAAGGGFLGAASGPGGAAGGAALGAAVGEGISLGTDWVAYRTIANAMTHPETAAKFVKALQVAARVVPYAVSGAVNVAGGEKSLKKVKEVGEKIKNQVSPPKPQETPAPQPTVQDFQKSGFLPHDTNGPQSSVAPKITHRYDPATDSLVSVV